MKPRTPHVPEGVTVDTAGSTRRIHVARNAAILAAISTAVVVALLAPMFVSSGPPMDEGILVTYPALILHGAVPGRDFETFYGPGGPYLTAGGFAVLGPHLWVERLVGLLGRLVIVLAIFAISLPWGRRIATGAAISAGVILFPLGLAAYALLLALAGVLAGLALTVAGSMFELRPANRAAAFAIGGFVSGTALLFRPDLLPAAVLPVVPLLGETRRAKQYGAGLALSLVPLVVYLGYVGPDRLHLIVRDLWASRPGRRLPVPSLHTTRGQLLAATAALLLLFIVVGGISAWKRSADRRERILLSVGLLLLTLFPVIVNRADSAHIVPVAAVAIPLFPVLAIVLQSRAGGRARSITLLATGVLATFTVLAVLHVALLGLREDVRLVDGSSRGVEVQLDASRSFRVDSHSTARDLDRALRVIDRVTSPGDSLFVGPRDLRRTNYDDAFVYYLLPKLKPSSYYLELNPGTANRSGSSLASDLERTDVLLLTTRYDDWNEPNQSRRLGSRAPSAVVAHRFCQIAKSGTYTVFRKCQAGRA